MGAREVWIGLIEVRHQPGAGVLMDRNKAFTNGLAFASNEKEYEAAVRGSLARLGFDVVSVEEPEPLAHRLQEFTVDPELLKLAQAVEMEREPRFGPFHTWTRDD